MAHIIPSELSHLAQAGVHGGELDTLRRLEKELPNDYSIFHGVHWSSEYEARTFFGEIDFVVINRAGDALFIEQKNGPLAETNNGLVKRYRDNEKNVADQIHRSLDIVRKKFQWQQGKQQALVVDYLVYCPDYRIRNINAPGLSADRIVDAASDGLAARIERVLGPGENSDDAEVRDWFQVVHGFFCQTFEVVPDIHAHLAGQQRQFVRHTGTLAHVLTNLEMRPWRLRVTGCAGSGKSLIARNFFAAAAVEDKRILLLCFNHALAVRFRAMLPTGGRVSTVLAYFNDFLEAIGQPLDFANLRSQPQFWDRVQDRIQAADIPADWQFDTLIVDEGQDFEPEWYETLRLFLTDDADILWLEDPTQNIYQKPALGLENFVGYRCSTNYRSPESIARLIQATLPFQFDAANPLPGMGVGVSGYERPEEQPAIVANLLRDLIQNRGFSHDDIVLLTCGGIGRSLFNSLDSVGGRKLRRITGEYDANGRQIMTEGQLHFDSIYRFKGQQAAAVILVDIDPRSDRMEREQRLLFCGMTRATVRLELVVNKRNLANQSLLEQ